MWLSAYSYHITMNISDTGLVTWLLFTFIIICWAPVIDCKCLKDIPDVQYKRHLYYNGNSHPLVLESSRRVSHRLTNQILKILLEEIIGYADVKIINKDSINASVILNRIAGCPPNQTGCLEAQEPIVPETMVNVEVWMVAGFSKSDWTETGRLIDCGPLGPSGKFGWYMTKQTVEEFWRNKTIIDHWKALKRPDVIHKFSLSAALSMINHLNAQQHNFTTCYTPDCSDRIYYGPKCNPTDPLKCAVLFSTYPDSYIEIPKLQIQNLNLPLTIIWLGSELTNFIKSEKKNGSHLLFFNWHPNTLTTTDEFTRVTFPFCSSTSHDKHVPYNCDFDVNQFTKVVWSKIKTNAPEAYNLISRLHFSQEQYENLLHGYNSKPHSTDEEIACDWIQNNKETWQDWIPENLTNKTKIYIGGLFPMSGPYWTQPGLVQGAELALDLINRNDSILREYSMELIISDSQCLPDVAMNAFIKYLANDTVNIAGVLGPGCSDEAEPIAALSKHFNMVVISYGAEASSLADRHRYPYFYRTIPQISHHRYVYEKFFKTMKWEQVGAIAESGQEFPGYHLMLQDHLMHKGISVVLKRKIVQDSTSFNVTEIFADLKAQKVKVIIADFYVFAARAIMCEAYKQNMTAHQGYVWFLPSWYSSEWWDVEFFNTPPSIGDLRPQENVPCTTAQMEYAIDGHFILSKAFSDADDAMIPGNITIGQFKSMYAKKVGKADVDESPFASYVYDAVWVYAFALDKLLKEQPSSLESFHSQRTTEKFVSKINITDFHGVTGHVKFDGSDRPGIVNILQVFHNETNLVASYFPARGSDSGRLVTKTDAIKWLTRHGVLPTDGSNDHSDCSVEDFRSMLNVSCEVAIIFINMIALVLFIMLTVAVLIFIKKRYDSKVKVTHNRMKELGLLSGDVSHCLSLDDWEIPREKIVINRKLGEGAFGTVFGGEALLENNGWVAVAVKTLKVGSNLEDKLDFLTEAEIMKRFQHPNIVQLLGVCTRGEPVYAVMEFLLHGDLKTYLLSRRSLLGRKGRKQSVVSPTQLTKIALDIAYGLKYLHDMKYVHRDLACRNCLVSCDNTVKIADFGMTRTTYDHDYYRFNRKGMLPVRWMSPESLWDGMFTSKSDVWSYGVVAYEIVTFGSFPYQGLSNNQVLEHVKKGERLQLPPTCNDEMKKFIHSCMAKDPDERPNMSSIIDLFCDKPDFLKPTLDNPTKSVVLECTNSLERGQTSCSDNLTHLDKSIIPSCNRFSSCSQTLPSGSQEDIAKVNTMVAIKNSPNQTTTFVCVDPPELNIVRHSSSSSSDSVSIPLQHMSQNNISLPRTGTQSEYSWNGDNSSDYYSDNSKELCQTVTSL